MNGRLACVLYETLAGQPPYTGATAAAILALKSLEGVPPLRVVRDAVPTGVEEAIIKALARIPADRFGTPSQFAEALERGRAVMTPAAPVSHRVPRRRLLLPTAAALVLVIAGAWWVTQWDPGAPAITSLAVLPLKNLMADPDQDYFVEGMQEALIAELSKIGALKVISRTSAMRYRETDKPMRQIARELGVEGLIEGSVLREGDQVRITVQLIHGPSDRYLWGQSFDRELRGILGLQSDVARSVAGEIKLTLTPQERTLLTSARTVNPHAYEAYLRGRYELTKIPENLEPAIRHFRQAIDIDPTYAPAYTGLADGHNRLAIYNERPPRELYPIAKAAVATALELDESLAEAHAMLGVIAFRYDWDWQTAERALQRALQLDPNSARAHLGYGMYLLADGRLQDFLAHASRHQQLDPLSPFAIRLLVWALTYNGRYEEALVQIHKGLELATDKTHAYLDLARTNLAMGNVSEALTACDYALSVGPNDPIVLGTCGRAQALAGSEHTARMTLAKLVDLSSRRFVDPYRVAEVAAGIYTGPAEADRIVTWLERAYEERSAELCFVNVEPAFERVRSDPAFQELLRRMNFSIEP
jgi:TolB-like protein